MGSINFAALISVALLGSFGHCIGMCGGFVAALNGGKIGKQAAFKEQLFFQTIYHFGRIGAYAFLGAVCGFLAQSISVTPKTQGFLFFALGFFMMLLGASLLGKIGFLSSIENSLLLKPSVKKIYAFLISSKNISSFFLLGFLNGFIPCGLVYFFLASAAASGSALSGALTMTIFGIMTLPSLIGFGFIVGLARDIMIKAAAFLVIAYGAYLCFKGYMMSVG